jgi:hypothetical protein
LTCYLIDPRTCETSISELLGGDRENLLFGSLWVSTPWLSPIYCYGLLRCAVIESLIRHCSLHRRVAKHPARAAATGS